MSFPASGDLFKFNNRNSRKKLSNMFRINEKDTTAMSMTPLGVFIADLEHISHLFSSAYC